MTLQQLKRRLHLRSLDTLMTVAQCGSMRKAAETLHLSQAAVSKAIMELESHLGVALLDRGRRGVELTLHGQALVRRSSHMFDELQQGMREFERLSDPAGGEVHLGCMETLNAGLVGAALEQVARTQVRARFSVYPGDSPDLVSHYLGTRICDFVVARPYEPQLPAGMSGNALFCDSLRLVTGCDHPLAGRRKIRLDELLHENWILSSNEVREHSPIGEGFRAAGLPLPAHRVVTGSLSLRYKLLATGRFVTAMPGSLLYYSKERIGLKILPIELPRWRTATMIITLDNRTLAPLAQLMIESICEFARPLAG